MYVMFLLVTSNLLITVIVINIHDLFWRVFVYIFVSIFAFKMSYSYLFKYIIIGDTGRYACFLLLCLTRVSGCQIGDKGKRESRRWQIKIRPRRKHSRVYSHTAWARCMAIWLCVSGQSPPGQKPFPVRPRTISPSDKSSPHRKSTNYLDCQLNCLHLLCRSR